MRRLLGIVVAAVMALSLPAAAQFFYGPQSTGGYGPQPFGTGGAPVTFEITAISLSTLAFTEPTAYVATATVAVNTGTHTGPTTLALSTTDGGCNGVNGAENASFNFTAGTFTLNGPSTQGTYHVCLAATVPGATNTPFGQAFVIIGAPPVGACSNALDFSDACNSQYLVMRIL